MKAALILFAFLMTLVFGVFAVAEDVPTIVRGSQKGSDIISYKDRNGDSLEGWEIVLDWVNGVYLNYSRAPWGDLTIKGEPVQVCYILGKDKKVVGISENKDRLMRALDIVLNDQVGYVNKNGKKWACDSYTAIVTRDPSHADLKIFVSSLDRKI